MGLNKNLTNPSSGVLIMQGTEEDKGNEMTDKELLEAAAKAAGIDVEWAKWVVNEKAFLGCCFKYKSTFDYWNPLTDDGDALRLAVELALRIDPCTDAVYVVTQTGSVVVHEVWKEDDNAATRRAIVRAAAEIGRTK